MLGVVVEGLARKRRVVVSRTSSCVITPLRLRSKTLYHIGKTWQKRTAHIQWGYSACSWRGRYRSCIVPGLEGVIRHWFHIGIPIVYLILGVLGDLLDFLTGEHAAVLDAIGSLESVVHSFKLLNKYIIGRLGRSPTNLWRFARVRDDLLAGFY